MLLVYKIISIPYYINSFYHINNYMINFIPLHTCSKNLFPFIIRYLLTYMYYILYYFNKFDKNLTIMMYLQCYATKVVINLICFIFYVVLNSFLLLFLLNLFCYYHLYTMCNLISNIDVMLHLLLLLLLF